MPLGISSQMMRIRKRRLFNQPREKAPETGPFLFVMLSLFFWIAASGLRPPRNDGIKCKSRFTSSAHAMINPKRISAIFSPSLRGAKRRGNPDQALIIAPFWNVVSVPSGSSCQTSSRVSGLDAITATRSFGVVSLEKSTRISSSTKVATPKGALRTI